MELHTAVSGHDLGRRHSECVDARVYNREKRIEEIKALTQDTDELIERMKGSPDDADKHGQTLGWLLPTLGHFESKLNELQGDVQVEFRRWSSSTISIPLGVATRLNGIETPVVFFMVGDSVTEQKFEGEESLTIELPEDKLHPLIYRLEAGVLPEDAPLNEEESQIIIDSLRDPARKKTANHHWFMSRAYDEIGELDKFLHHIRLAADQDHAAAQFELALSYESGEGVVKDFEKSARLYQLAADQGHIEAQYRLGACYYTGKGVTKDLTESIRLCRLTAEHGLPEGQHQLGIFYKRGEGVTKDFGEAIRLFRLAADRGEVNAQTQLAWQYLVGEGVAKDLIESIRLFRLATDQGLAAAQLQLSACYHNGEGVTKDVVEAVRLCRLAADQGLAQAQYYLGMCYKKGDGVTKDLGEAARLFRLAADQGDTTSQSQLKRYFVDF